MPTSSWPPSPQWPSPLYSTLSPELALSGDNLSPIKRAAAAAPQSAARGRLSEERCSLAPLYRVLRAPRFCARAKARAWEAHRGRPARPEAPCPDPPRPSRPGKDMGCRPADTSCGRVVCLVQKKTAAASAGYGTGCSSSAPSSAPRLGRRTPRGDALAPTPAPPLSGAPGLAGDAAAAAAGLPGPRAQGHADLVGRPHASVMVSGWQHLRGQAVTRSRERHPRPLQAARSAGNSHHGRRDVLGLS